MKAAVPQVMKAAVPQVHPLLSILLGCRIRVGNLLNAACHLTNREKIDNFACQASFCVQNEKAGKLKSDSKIPSKNLVWRVETQ